MRNKKVAFQNVKNKKEVLTFADVVRKKSTNNNEQAWIWLINSSHYFN